MPGLMALQTLLLVFSPSVACGPSSKQMQTAAGARYKTDAFTIFEIAEEAAKEKFKIAQTDPERGAFITVAKWYSPDGQSESAGVGDVVKVEDGSLLVALLVEVAAGEQAGTVKVTVTPVVERFRLGQAQHDKVAPNDPSLPGWVTGKAATLAVEIHERAKQYAVAGS